MDVVRAAAHCNRACDGTNADYGTGRGM